MRSIRWLSKEANSRAVLTALAVAGWVGTLGQFAWNNVAIPLNPGLATTEFANGYRAGSTEKALQQEIDSLRAQLQINTQLDEIDRQIEAMSDEELDASLKSDL